MRGVGDGRNKALSAGTGRIDDTGKKPGKISGGGKMGHGRGDGRQKVLSSNGAFNNTSNPPQPKTGGAKGRVSGHPNSGPGTVKSGLGVSNGKADYRSAEKGPSAFGKRDMRAMSNSRDRQQPAAGKGRSRDEQDY